MSAALTKLALAWAACALFPAPALATGLSGSALALPLLEPGGTPRLALAQRTITRSWGPSEDSVYVEVAVPEWRSEGFAAAGSALLPGAGQAYLGETGGALLFALAEVAGWTARYLFLRSADDAKDDAIAFAGDPGDSASAWSFEKWEAGTGESAAELRRLYDADRDAFYHLIANDASYAAGWGGGGDASRLQFRSDYDRSQRAERRAGYAGGALWLNHLVAAVDALRAARLHNVPLAPDTRLRLGTSWNHGPGIEATIVRRF